MTLFKTQGVNAKFHPDFKISIIFIAYFHSIYIAIFHLLLILWKQNVIFI